MGVARAVLMSAVMVADKFACPCCACLTLPSEPPGTFGLCPVCFWADDEAQFHDPELATGQNPTSLNEARRFYHRFGACDTTALAAVRPARVGEEPHFRLAEPAGEVRAQAV
jgi:hypothetical protein